MNSLLTIGVIIIILFFITRKIYRMKMEKNLKIAENYYLSGVVHDENNNWDQAIEDFTRAILIKPKSGRYLYNSTYINSYKRRGDLYNKKLNYDQAIEDYSQVIQLTELSEKEAMMNYKKIALDELRDFKKYEVYSCRRKIAETLVLRGDIYIKKEQQVLAITDYNNAIAYYNDIIESFPNNNVDISKRGDIFSKIGDNGRAIADYNKAIAITGKEIEPDDYLGLYFRGQLYVKKGEYNKAITDFEAVLRINPNNVEDYDDKIELEKTQSNVKKELDDLLKTLKR